MFDDRIVERAILDLAAEGWVEDFLLVHCMDFEFGADPLRERLFSARCAGFPKFLEQLFNGPMISFQQRDRVCKFILVHDGLAFTVVQGSIPQSATQIGPFAGLVERPCLVCKAFGRHEMFVAHVGILCSRKGQTFLALAAEVKVDLALRREMFMVHF